MQCSSCGTQLPAGASYCPICGKETSSELSDPLVPRPDPSSSDPNQYLEDMPFSTPSPPSFSSPHTSEALTNSFQSHRSRGIRPPTSPGTRRTLLLVLVLLVLLIGIGATILVLFQKAHQGQTNPYSPNPGALALNVSLSNANHYLPTNTNCAFTGGAYRLTAPKGNYTNCIGIGGPLFGDLAFEIKMTVLKGNCGGIVFRDDAEGHYYLFEVCPNGDYEVYLYFGQSGNDFETLQIGHSPTIKTGLNQSNLIAAVAIGQDIHLFINRQSISTLRDKSYSIGKIGFIADGSANATVVAYNNLKVWTF
jgi:hypothetical protein